MERFKDLLDFDNYLNVKPKLSPRSQEFMSVMYGPPNTLNVEEDVKAVPSANDAIKGAEDYLVREKAKGFVSDTDLAQVSNPLFRTRLLRTNVADKAKQVDTDPTILLNKLYESEPYQQFWFESKTVVKTIAAIQALPFLAPLFQAQATSNLIDAVATLVRVMKHNGFLEAKKKTTKELRQAMTQFVTKTKDAKSKIIEQLIKEKKLDISKLAPETKAEYAQHLPEPEKKEQGPALTIAQKLKQQEVDQRILAQVAESAAHLPRCYRYNIEETTSEAFSKQKKEMRHLLTILPNRIQSQLDAKNESTEQARPSSYNTPRDVDKQNRKVQPIIIVKPFNRPKKARDLAQATRRSRPPKMSTSQVNQMFWQDNDPLTKNRYGEFFNTLSDMQNIVESLTYEKRSADMDDIPAPFKYESKDPALVIKQNEGVMLMDDIWNTADVISSHASARFDGSTDDNNNPNNNNNNNADGTPGQPLPMADYNSLSYNGAQRQMDIIEYVSKFNLGNDKKSDSNAQETHTKLGLIWDELGFSIQQKLGLVLKYSENAEEGAKLKESLQMWEQALEVARQYENDYRSYKDFLKHDVFDCPHVELMIHQHEAELTKVENNVHSIADILRKQYEDELILKKKKYSDLFEQRRTKLNEMISDVRERFVKK